MISCSAPDDIVGSLPSGGGDNLRVSWILSRAEVEKLLSGGNAGTEGAVGLVIGVIAGLCARDLAAARRACAGAGSFGRTSTRAIGGLSCNGCHVNVNLNINMVDADGVV